jgi:peptidoglycan/LPS O-acetylase OafA/YrhL
VNPRLRDGLLAVGALVVLLASAGLAGAVDALTDPGAVLVGTVGALLLELAFLRYPERTRELWERPLVQAVSFVVVAGAGVLAVQSGLGWILAALAWGLLAYLLLLAVVVGLGKNPLAGVVR